MKNNHFKVKSKINLDDAKVGDIIQPSDFATLTPNGSFVQLEYIEDKFETEKYEVKPGLYTIHMTPMGCKLEKTTFSKDKLLPTFGYTSQIVNNINLFFTKLDIYKKYGIDVPKRATLLYGPPGGGKTSAVTEVVNELQKMDNCCIITWPSDKIRPNDVKDFVKTFTYIGVEKLLLIIEDIGGIEVDQVKLPSQSGLLSLLDNQEKTFTLPTAIIATTNHPESFLGNITQRPGRFDDKLEVGFPNAQQRRELYKFFSQDEVSEDALEEIEKNIYKEFTPAHIKEVFLRSDIHNLSRVDAMRSIVKDIELYKNYFEKNKVKIGINNYDEDY